MGGLGEAGLDWILAGEEGGQAQRLGECGHGPTGEKIQASAETGEKQEVRARVGTHGHHSSCCPLLLPRRIAVSSEQGRKQSLGEPTESQSTAGNRGVPLSFHWTSFALAHSGRSSGARLDWEAWTLLSASRDRDGDHFLLGTFHTPLIEFYDPHFAV